MINAKNIKKYKNTLEPPKNQMELTFGFSTKRTRVLRLWPKRL